MRFKYKRYSVQIPTFTTIGLLVVAVAVGITYSHTWWRRNGMRRKPAFSPMTSLDVNPLSDKYMFNVSAVFYPMTQNKMENHPMDLRNASLEYFQVQSDLFMAIYRVTEMEPDWLQWYNVAEINYEDTTVREHLGEGKFGMVSNGVIQLENGLK